MARPSVIIPTVIAAALAVVVAVQANNPSKPNPLAAYENGDQLFSLQYPADWVLHSEIKQFANDDVLRLGLTANPNPSITDNPVLSIEAERSFQYGNEKDWVSSKQISNYANVKDDGTIDIGDKTYRHFEIRDSVPGSPTEPHTDFYVLLRKRYPATAEVGSVPTSFIGFGVSSDSSYKIQVFDVIKSYQPEGVFAVRTQS